MEGHRTEYVTRGARPPVSTAATVAALAALQFALGASALAGQEERSCGDRGSLEVTVLDETGTAVRGATVSVRWTDVVRRPVRRSTGADGRLVICAPRDARKATVWGQVGSGSSEQAVVAFGPGETREIALRVPAQTTSPGRLMGRVFDAQTKDAIRTAAVTVAGRPPAVESDRWGRFILTGVPAGPNELEVRRLGYAPLSHTINVKPGLATEVEIGLVPDPVEMEPLVATTTWSPGLEAKGFYERRYWGEMLGIGEFITQDYLERWQPYHISQLLSNHTRLRPRLLSARRGARVRAADCLTIYLDSMNVSNLPINTIVVPSEVAGVEVYRAPVSLPTGLMRFHSGCNLVLIWTK
ncbi:carboxypeptidase regulatory-like domain-containing protein [Candidatus Palauibacter sp.]|uniref:carboxypeptidase regulatory-like domain-containing protein n=1 Tax=Candidatus Palauibacter sp. TaxID=3101350 RepID=UPI003C6F993F